MNSREEWLEERKKGIGGSDAAAVMNKNPYMSQCDLWEIKTGRKVQDDISEKECVSYGIKAEEYIRALFNLEHPEYEILSCGTTIIQHPKYPFLLATIDGQLTELQTGRKGVLEIKTTTVRNAQGFDDWKDRVPQAYYIQILHYLNVTGFAFAVLRARIRMAWIATEIIEKEYTIDKSEPQVILDCQLLLDAEIEFWNKYVVADVRPPLDLGL